MDEKKLLNYAWNLYGQSYQLNIVVEELSELIKAICKYNRYGHSEDIVENICEEVADCLIVIQGLMLSLNISSTVETYKKIKLNRLEEMVKNL
jgi:NTP pyrophosphatase (non-canonical NTP hydrolase)